MNKFRSEDGQVLVITALCMVAFLGFLALATDIGMLFNTRRQLQTAADAAATAAAVRYLSLYNATPTPAGQISAQTTAISAGQSAATTNMPGSTPTVSVNTNPSSPTAHQGCLATTCYFEAIVSAPNPTVFYRAFLYLWQGTTASSFNVAARAVAGTPGNSTNCIYLENPSGTALTTQGKWTISAPNCGLYINSTSSSVQNDTGNSAKAGISAASIEIAGPAPNDLVIASGSNTTVVHALPQGIPFDNVPAPTVPGTCPAAPGGKLTGTVTAGCYSGSVIIGTATLGAGTYIFTGNVTINGAVTGTSGVTLDIDSGSLTIAPGNSNVNLTAPTSGTYSGIVIYMPSGNTNNLNLQAGSSTGTLTGFIFAPGATLVEQDNGGGLTVQGLVVNNINNGPASLTITGYSSSTSPLKVVSLVE